MTVKATAQVRIEAQAKAAEAALGAAKAQLEQAKALSKTRITSQLAQAKAGVRIAEAHQGILRIRFYGLGRLHW